MAKSPRPGYSKTRLCPPLKPEQAAALSAAFLSDTTESLAAASLFAPIVTYAAYAPLGTERFLLPHLALRTTCLLADRSVPMPDGVRRHGARSEPEAPSRRQGMCKMPQTLVAHVFHRPWPRAALLYRTVLRAWIRQYTLGDASQQVLREMWNSPAYKDSRESLLSETPPAPCQNCGMRLSL
jgi:hypothetical protein